MQKVTLSLLFVSLIGNYLQYSQSPPSHYYGVVESRGRRAYYYCQGKPPEVDCTFKAIPKRGKS